jgi:hypothetical protein
MRGLLVRPIGTSNHLEKPPRIFFPPGLPNEMVTVYAAANDAISYIYISPIRNVNIDSFSGCAALTSTQAAAAIAAAAQYGLWEAITGGCTG